MGNITSLLKTDSPAGIKHKLFYPIRVVLLITFFPALILAAGISHLELLLKLGSENDPLGYTVIAKKNNNKIIKCTVHISSYTAIL